MTTSPSAAPAPLSGPVEDYLKAIYDLERDEHPASTNDIAERLDISPASVSGMMRRLDGTNEAIIRDVQSVIHILEIG